MEVIASKTKKLNEQNINSPRFPRLSKSDDLCFCQLTSAMTFISQQTKRKFKIYHKINCKSEYVIYLMECTLCKQYVGKAETAFNIRLNNHRKDTMNPNVILACRHFQKQGHSLNSLAKFRIINRLVNTSS